MKYRYQRRCGLLQYLFILFFIFPLAVQATPLDINKLFKQMIDMHQSNQSQALLKKVNRYKDELEGEPTFDYFLGVSSIDNGEYSEGIFALERVLDSGETSQYYNQHLVKLELARGYFLLGDNDLAKQLFNETLALNPPQSVVDKVDSFLAAIEQKEKQYQTQWSGFVQQSFGYDDNVNALPDDIVRFFGVFASDLNGESDGYSETKLGIAYQQPLTRKHSFFIATDAFLRNNYHVDTMDNEGLNVNIGNLSKFDKTTFRVAYYHQYYKLDGDGYRRMDGLLGSYKHEVSKSTLLTGNLSMIDYNYRDNDSLDAQELIARLGAMHQFPAKYQSTAFMQLYIGESDAKENDSLALAIAQRSFSGTAVGVQLKLREDLSLAASYLYQHSDYAKQHPYFSEIREDRLTAYSLDMQWDIKDQWKMLAKVSYIKNESSLTLYKYEKTYGQLGVRYEF